MKRKTQGAERIGIFRSPPITDTQAQTVHRG
jgi:hypothetical protein